MTELSQHLSNAFGDRPGIGPLTFAAAFLVMALAMPRGISGAWATFVAARRSHPGGGVVEAPPPEPPEAQDRNVVPLAAAARQDADDVNPPTA